MKIIKPTKGLFEHNHVFTGYEGGTPYLSYKKGGGEIDGTGRQHIRLYGRCDICNQEILVAMIHVDENGTLYNIKSK